MGQRGFVDGLPLPRSLGKKGLRGGSLRSPCIPHLRTSKLGLQAQRNKRQRGGQPPPKDSEGHCTLVQAIPHHEGLPRLACPRVAGLPPAPPSLSPFLEGQTGREVRGAALTCVYQTQPDAGLGRQEATLK